MVTPGKRNATLRRAVMAASAQIESAASARICITSDDDGACEMLRTQHAKYCKEKKTYFSLRTVVDRKGCAAYMCIDRDMAQSMAAYLKAAGDGKEDTELVSATLAAYGGRGHVLEGMRALATPIADIDTSFSMSEKSSSLAVLIEGAAGISGPQLETVAKERFMFAYRSMFSYLTLVCPDTQRYALLGFVHASLAVGFCHGLPIRPLDEAKWRKELGLGGDFSDMAEKAYDFLILELYLERLFPMLGAHERERMMHDPKRSLEAIRCCSLGAIVPTDVLESAGMGKKEVDDAVRRLGPAYD